MSLGEKTKLLWKNPEYRKRMSEAHKGSTTGFKKGHSITNTGRTRFKKGQTSLRKGVKLSSDIREKISKGKREKPILKTRGENNWNWKGGTSRTQDKIVRQSVEYKLWRRSVFERDNYTCVWCGFKGKVQADHIKRFSDYPELRFAIDNGRTLCVPCHLTTETYGGNKK